MTCPECLAKLVLLNDDQGSGIICPRCGREPRTDEAITLLKEEREKDEDSSVS